MYNNTPLSTAKHKFILYSLRSGGAAKKKKGGK